MMIICEINKQLFKKKKVVISILQLFTSKVVTKKNYDTVKQSQFLKYFLQKKNFFNLILMRRMFDCNFYFYFYLLW